MCSMEIEGELNVINAKKSNSFSGIGKRTLDQRSPQRRNSIDMQVLPSFDFGRECVASPKANSFSAPPSPKCAGFTSGLKRSRPTETEESRPKQRPRWNVPSFPLLQARTTRLSNNVNRFAPFAPLQRIIGVGGPGSSSSFGRSTVPQAS